jgi:hypothetical protein
MIRRLLSILKQRLPWTKAEQAAADRYASAPPSDDPLLEASLRAHYAHNINMGADMTDDERSFCMALDEYKLKYHRPFPTSTEVLEVLKHLGYRLEKK